MLKYAEIATLHARIFVRVLYTHSQDHIHVFGDFYALRNRCIKIICKTVRCWYYKHGPMVPYQCPGVRSGGTVYDPVCCQVLNPCELEQSGWLPFEKILGMPISDVTDLHNLTLGVVVEAKIC